MHAELDSSRCVASDFSSQGVRCAADLYLPEDVARPPIVIMAHGFGAERRFGLPTYAGRFAAMGIAVLLFDYRGIGGSDGTPRQLVDPARHLQDWEAALAHVRTLPQVDGRRVALWGSSFSGGHVIVCAARDGNVAAIVAQVPFVDPFTTIRRLGLRYLLKATPHGVLDAVRALFGMTPHYVKLVGAPDEFAAMNTPEALEGFMSLVPEGTQWENKICARVLFTFPFYRPLNWASRVRCPVLLLFGEKDSLIAPAAVREAASRMANVQAVSYPLGHFEIYTGEAFNDAIARQCAFLHQHLQR